MINKISPSIISGCTSTNTGTHPLIIYRVTASCGCTEGTITVTYDAAHQGRFKHKVSGEHSRPDKHSFGWGFMI